MFGETEPMTVNATLRLRRIAGRDNRVIVVLQRRFMLFFWKDWYPIENATRSLEHEAIELYDRLKYILDTEIKEASTWVKKAREKAEIDCARNGKGTPFKDVANLKAEAEMPDLSDRFKEISKALRHGPKSQRTSTRSTYLLPQHANLHDQKKLGEEYDHTIPYREPQQQQPKRNRGRKNQSQNPGNKRHVLVEVDDGDQTE